MVDSPKDKIYYKSQKLEILSREILDIILGENILPLTKFEFIEHLNGDLTSEYYLTGGLKFFDFWYHPKSDYIFDLVESLHLYAYKVLGDSYPLPTTGAVLGKLKKRGYIL